LQKKLKLGKLFALIDTGKMKKKLSDKEKSHDFFLSPDFLPTVSQFSDRFPYFPENVETACNRQIQFAVLAALYKFNRRRVTGFQY